jgi:hypothetical protein
MSQLNPANIKIQRPGPQMLDQSRELLPAADLGRSATDRGNIAARKESTKRSRLRRIHIAYGLPIFGYIV